MPQVILDFLTLVSLKVLTPLGILVAALLLVLVGWLLAKLLQLVVVWILEAVNLDKGLNAIRFNTMLKKAEVKKTASELVGELVYWFSMVIVILAVAGAFGLGFALDTLDGMLSYVPVVFSAAIVLGLTVFLAVFLSNLIQFILLNLGLAYAKIIARIVNYAIIIFGFVIALAQFGFNLNWIVINISVVVGAIGLGAALAFGLGCKDMAADFLYNLFKGK